MDFNPHYELRGKHAVFSPSSPSWLNYDQEKAFIFMLNSEKAALGTRQHAAAAECIDLGWRLGDKKTTIGMYVNDCIGFGMKTEQPLKYSDNIFGTADAILFQEKAKRLFIFDLKTGTSQAHIEQLYIYAALFCLEYGKDPSKIQFELRLYQNNEIDIRKPDWKEIKAVMEAVIQVDQWAELSKKVGY